MKVRTLIYGSCVSRDTFAYLPDHFELRDYVARQSLISAYTKPAVSVQLPALSSRFQQRMLEGDRLSSLPATLMDNPNTDLILWDITDERLGVYLLADGSCVTRTVELVESGAEANLPPGAKLLRWGTPQHFHLWLGSLAQFASMMGENGSKSRIELIDVPWATRFADGGRPPSSYGLEAHRANRIRRRYIRAAVRALNLRPIRLRKPTEILAARDHRWGPAPFHYTDSVYTALAEAIAQRTNMRP